MLYTDEELKKIFYKKKIIVKKVLKVSKKEYALYSFILENFASDFPPWVFLWLDRLKKNPK